jgi:hypothetical protein
VIKLKLFLFGWHKRNCIALAFAGCPLWLIKYRCAVSPGWGSETGVLKILGKPNKEIQILGRWEDD